MPAWTPNDRGWPPRPLSPGASPFLGGSTNRPFFVHRLPPCPPHPPSPPPPRPAGNAWMGLPCVLLLNLARPGPQCTRCVARRLPRSSPPPALPARALPQHPHAAPPPPPPPPQLLRAPRPAWQGGGWGSPGCPTLWAGGVARGRPRGKRPRVRVGLRKGIRGGRGARAACMASIVMPAHAEPLAA